MKKYIPKFLFNSEMENKFLFRKQLDIIQIFRGLAAIMVLFHHIIPSLGYFQDKNYEFLNVIYYIGKYGVDFFFILSGFIITYSNFYKKNNNIKKYYKSRLIRIYIPYLPIGIGLLLLYLLFPGISESSREISVLTSITLFPHGEPALAVAWTLTFEMLFYSVFIIFIIHKKAWNIFAICWSFLILIYYISGFHFKNALLEVVLSPYNLEFLLGYVLCVLLLQYQLMSKKVILSGIFVFAMFFLVTKFLWNDSIFFLTNILFTFIVFFMIYFYVGLKKSKNFRKNNIWMLIGNATYSIYLVHGPLHAFIERFLPLTNSVSIYMIYIVVTAVICIISGYLYYLIFEKRVLNYVKSKMLK